MTVEQHREIKLGKLNLLPLHYSLRQIMQVKSAITFELMFFFKDGSLVRAEILVLAQINSTLKISALISTLQKSIFLKNLLHAPPEGCPSSSGRNGFWDLVFCLWFILLKNRFWKDNSHPTFSVYMYLILPWKEKGKLYLADKMRLEN